ncbi:MAG: haloacid dehalogenase type II [Pseudomonadota bacterium]
MKLSDFSALTFDCYGTLIDWESGIINALKPITDPLDLDRDQILQAHALHESQQQRTTPSKNYREVLAVVYKRLAEQWGVPVSWDQCLHYGRSVEHWPAFKDSAESLHYLKEHYKLVILSNVDNASFAFSNQKLEVEFDAIYTAEDIGSYKPSNRNFEYMLEKLSGLDVGRSDILHTAESLFHDHQPANLHQLSNCWIYRRHSQPGFGATRNPGNQPRIDFTFNSMAELVAAHKLEVGGV